MFAQYFGNFLLNSGLVSASDLERAMDAQKQIRVKLGVLAINRGYMTPEQVEEVHQAQTRMDKRFGEIAVELGYITEERINELLSSQQTAHLALGQSLIDLGLMNYDSFGNALADYKKAHSLSDEQFELITHGDIDVLLSTTLFKDKLANDSAWAKYINLFAKNSIRFIDGDIRMEDISDSNAGTYEWLVEQPIRNSERSVARKTILAGSEASFLELASRFAQEKVYDVEMMQAAVGEFLNLHNGIFLVNESNNGLELDLDPQTFRKGSASVGGKKVVVRITATHFSFDLILEDLSELA